MSNSGLAQFVHIEVYAKTPRKIKQTKIDVENRIQRKNHSINDIVAECERRKGYCDHIENIQEPILVAGVWPSEVEKDINNKIKLCSEMQITGKYREDTPVLLAGVMSYPISNKSFEDQGKIAIDDDVFSNWINESVIFLEKRFDKKLKSIVLHLDEEYPHIHFYCNEEITKENKLSLKKIHPGYLLQEELGRRNQETKLEGLKRFSNDYYESVSINFGHERTLGKRERLSRKEYLDMRLKKQRKEIQRNKKLEELEEQKRISFYNKSETEKKYKDVLEENFELKEEIKLLKRTIILLKKAIEQVKESLTLKLKKETDFENAKRKVHERKLKRKDSSYDFGM